MSIETVAAAVRDIPDFPKPGIVFKDITPILRDPVLFRESAELLAAGWERESPDAVGAVDARGFIYGATTANLLGVGFIPLRKQGKLPWRTVSAEYDLEYGSAVLEMHEDAVKSGDRILIVDDLLATGGTAAAAVDLIVHRGGTVIGIAFLMELCFLNGRERLNGYRVESLIKVND